MAKGGKGEENAPFFVFLAGMHEVHSIDEFVHYFLLFIGGYVWMLGDDFSLLVDEVIE